MDPINEDKAHVAFLEELTKDPFSLDYEVAVVSLSGLAGSVRHDLHQLESVVKIGAVECKKHLFVVKGEVFIFE